jgi:hypothetical protein
MIPWFTATQPFTPADGDRWIDYVKWSGLTQLQEVVSLDGMLCPTLLPEIKDEYWPHRKTFRIPFAFLGIFYSFVISRQKPH